MANPDNKNEQAVTDNTQLPLYSFFVLLKQNGFSVTPRQITDSNKIISQYAPAVKNEDDLCDYLSPLFAQNENEQKQFRELFEHYFFHTNVIETTSPKRKKIIGNIKRHWWKYLVACTIIVITFLIIRSWMRVTHDPNIVLALNSATAERDFSNAFKLKPNEKLELLPQKNSVSDRNLRTWYDWGDNSSIDTLLYHSYQREGNYTITAYLAATPGKNNYKATATAPVKVCSEKTQIAFRTPTDSVMIHRPVRIEMSLSGKQPDSIIWSIDDSQQTGKSNRVFSPSFNTGGNHNVYCMVVYDSLNSPCTIQNSLALFVYDPNKPPLTAVISKSANAIHLSAVNKIKTSWLLLAGGVLLLSLFLYNGFRILLDKEKKKTNLLDDDANREYQDLLNSSSSKKPPFELPLHNKNYLPIPEQGLNALSRQMRRRVNEDTSYLDLPRTIQRSIDSGGLFQPVTLPRTQQSEYLFLIDEGESRNQQVKLFEFLAGILSQQNVNIEKYYYKSDLNICYPNNSVTPISFEKLSEKYSRHVLLIFGNGYELLFPYYPVFNYDYLKILNRWQYKAVITPISFVDWTSKEIKGLLPVIPIFPADVEGLLLCIKTMFDEDTNIAATLYKQQKSFYEVEKVDFENIEELESYCRNADAGIGDTNILFQWVAALAVYPKIRWEIILSIGKALLDKYDSTDQLNYSTLLRIARIKWIRHGQFPDYMRLELLKKLKLENEVIARQAILSLLKEMPETEINSSHFAYEEKVMQQIINETNLYAYDPVKYSQYERSKAVFDQLWKNKKIQDSPARMYFKGGNWKTLFDKNGSDNGNHGIEQYLNQQNNRVGEQAKIYQRGIFICSVVFCVVLISFLGLVGLNFFNHKKLPGLTTELNRLQNVSFTYLNKTGDTIYNTGRLSVDTISETLENNKANAVQLVVSDSTRRVSFSSGEKDIYDSASVIDQNAYTISLDKSSIIPASKITVTLHIYKECNRTGSQYSQIVKEADTSLVIKEIFTTDHTNSIHGCINSIAYGKRVSTEVVNAIVEAFKQSGITLQTGSSPGYSLADDEISLDYAGATSKPTIYIQYNNKQNLQQIRQLQACLNSSIFNVPGIEYQSNFSRNEVRYYENSTQDSIKLLQSCLKSIYPGRTFYPVKVPIRHSDARAEVCVYDSVLSPPVKPIVFIRISDDSLRASAEGFSKQLEGYGYHVNSVVTGTYSTNSQIYYFEPAMAGEAKNILQYYSRYYPALPLKTQLVGSFGRINSGIVVWIKKREGSPIDSGNVIGNRILAVASREIGYKENPIGSNRTKYGEWFGLNGQSWSAIFVSWVYAYAGKPLPPIDGKMGFASYNAALEYFTKRKLIVNNPVPGDIVIFEARESVQQMNRPATQISGFVPGRDYNGETNYSGGIFAGWDNQKEGSYEIIQGNAAVSGAPEGQGVLKLKRNKNSFKTYFIHVK